MICSGHNGLRHVPKVRLTSMPPQRMDGRFVKAWTARACCPATCTGEDAARHPAWEKEIRQGVLLPAPETQVNYCDADAEVVIDKGFLLDIHESNSEPIVRWVGPDSEGKLRVCTFVWTGGGWALYKMSLSILNTWKIERREVEIYHP